MHASLENVIKVALCSQLLNCSKHTFDPWIKSKWPSKGEDNIVSARRLMKGIFQSGFFPDTRVVCSAEPLFVFAENGELDPEIARVNSLGFIGCLSVVQFNNITPLKAALLYPSSSPVIVKGQLGESHCGASSPASPSAVETTHSLSGEVSVTPIGPNERGADGMQEGDR